MKIFSLMAACALTITLSAETIKYDLQKEFSKSSSVVISGDVLTFKGAGSLVFPWIKLDPNAKYTFSAELKQVDGAKSFPFHCGFYCYDKNRRMITHETVSIIAKTNTVLAEDVKVGDKEIKVKDASAWRKGAWVAFNAKDDLSDLPNRTMASYVANIEKKGDVWVVTMTRPLKQAFAAGTGVREHSSGGYVYTRPSGKLTADWVANTGTISGVNPLTNGGYFKKFWPGTVYIRPMLLLNWNWSDRTGEVQVRNVSLTIEK